MQLQSDHDENETKKSNFLTSKNYQLLKEAQKMLQDTTGYSPSIKTLINEIINEDAVNTVTNKIHLKFKSIN